MCYCGSVSGHIGPSALTNLIWFDFVTAQIHLELLIFMQTCTLRNPWGNLLSKRYTATAWLHSTVVVGLLRQFSCALTGYMIQEYRMRPTVSTNLLIHCTSLCTISKVMMHFRMAFTKAGSFELWPSELRIVGCGVLYFYSVAILLTKDVNLCEYQLSLFLALFVRHFFSFACMCVFFSLNTFLFSEFIRKSPSVGVPVTMLRFIRDISLHTHTVFITNQKDKHLIDGTSRSFLTAHAKVISWPLRSKQSTKVNVPVVGN